MARHSGVLINLIREENIKIFAEIGVQFGINLQKIFKSPNGKIIEEYWAIDAWGVGFSQVPKDGWIITEKDWHDLYKGVNQFMLKFKQIRVIRLPSVEAATLFPDEYFDMVYIDAFHSFDAVTQDIKVWLPKVKIDGIFGGHDYNKRSVRRAVDKQFTTGVWEPWPAPEKQTRVWLKRRLKTDEVERQPVFQPMTKEDVWIKNKDLKWD